MGEQMIPNGHGHIRTRRSSAGMTTSANCAEAPIDTASKSDIQQSHFKPKMFRKMFQNMDNVCSTMSKHPNKLPSTQAFDARRMGRREASIRGHQAQALIILTIAIRPAIYP